MLRYLLYGKVYVLFIVVDIAWSKSNFPMITAHIVISEFQLFNIIELSFIFEERARDNSLKQRFSNFFDPRASKIKKKIFNIKKTHIIYL